MIYRYNEQQSLTMLNLAMHMVYVAAESRVDTIVDLGSHEGHLLHQLSRLTRGVKVVGYEAIEDNCTKALSKDGDFVINHATIVPDGTVVTHLHTTEKTWSGSLASSIYKLGDNDFLIEAGPNISVSELCTYLSTLTNSMVKINIEGVDIAVVEKLIEVNSMPKAIVFELMPGDVAKSRELFSTLQRWYYIPVDLIHEGCASYCFSSNSGFVKSLTADKNGMFKTFRR